MTSVAWTVKVGTVNSPTDFSSRVMGVNISQPLSWMQPSPHMATIELLNNDGELTPAEGGGVGTYKDVDWLSQGAFISVEMNSTDTAEVFHGLVNRFDIYDDGITSTVTLSVVDPLSAASQVVIDNTYGPTPGGSDWLSTGVALEEYITNISESMPALGASSVSGSCAGYLITADNEVMTADQLNAYLSSPDAIEYPATFGDILSSQIMATGLCVMWPTRITAPASTTIEYDFAIVGVALTRVDPTLTTIPAYLAEHEFTLVEGSPASGEIPFRSLDLGYNLDERFNAATITSVATYAGDKTFEIDDATLIGKYGRSDYSATKTLNGSEASTQTLAGGIVGRFGPVLFTVNRVELVIPHFGATIASGDELALLLDAGSGLYQKAAIEYTPTGASTATTVDTIIFGRTINVQPDRTTVSLMTIPAALFSSFILDSTTEGVLGTDRLG